MLAQDMRRLAEEIAGAYEERARSLSELKVTTSEKLSGFRSDLEGSNRDRAERVQAELKEMGDSLRSDLHGFRSGLKQYQSDLDEAEKIRKREAREEISERAKHIADLRKDIFTLISDFGNARKEMWHRLQSDLADLTRALAGFRKDLADANTERIERVSAELKDMGDRLRLDIRGFKSMLHRFKADLDKAENARREEAQAEIDERRRELDLVLGSTRDLLKEFGTQRQEMWDRLRNELEAFSSELSQFKKDVESAEKMRKKEALADGSERRRQLAALDTPGLLRDFGVARNEMWRLLKLELDDFAAGLARFKAELDRSEEGRKEAMGRELKEGAEELRSALSGFASEMAGSVAAMMGELKKDRAEAVQAWNQILSGMRASQSGKAFLSEKAPAAAAQPVGVRVEKKVEAMPEKGSAAEKDLASKEAEDIGAEFKGLAHAESPFENAPVTEMEDEFEEEDEREGLISEILGMLEDHPEGLRMVEIAEILGMDNWRALIPFMRELLEDGDVRKEDSTYFIV